MDSDRVIPLHRGREQLARRLERRFGARSAAEDAVQEALIRAWQLQARGDQVTSWDAWVSTTATNFARMELRRRSAEDRAVTRLATLTGAASAVDPRWPGHDDAGGAAAEVADAVRRLPNRLRQVVLLHYYADLPLATVGDRLGISEGTVKRALHDARRRLAADIVPDGVSRTPPDPSTWRGPVQGWIMAGSHPAQYRFDVDRRNPREGAPVGVLRSVADRADGFGTIMQTFSAADYRRRRLRLSGDAMVDGVSGWFGFWMRVDSADQQAIAFDNMESRALTGTTRWGRHEVVLDVAAKAEAVAFGALLCGTGLGRIGNLRLEEVGTDVPVTDVIASPLPPAPINLDFAAD